MSPACKYFGLWLSLPFVCLAKVDFVHQVMPIFKKHCAECHTDGAKKGGLSMNTRMEFLAGGEGGQVAVPVTGGQLVFGSDRYR
ncbi:MAG: c-type cytochrome domain-containing protein [Opitutales bacterium]